MLVSPPMQEAPDNVLVSHLTEKPLAVVLVLDGGVARERACSSSRGGAAGDRAGLPSDEGPTGRRGCFPSGGQV